MRLYVKHSYTDSSGFTAVEYEASKYDENIDLFVLLETYNQRSERGPPKIGDYLGFRDVGCFGQSHLQCTWMQNQANQKLLPKISRLGPALWHSGLSCCLEFRYPIWVFVQVQAVSLWIQLHANTSVGAAQEGIGETQMEVQTPDSGSRCFHHLGSKQ